MEACAVICRKATVARPDANPCLFEHKIEVFVSECAIFPRFWAVLTQNRHFCTLLGYGTPVLGHFEHNIGLFVLEKRGKEASVSLNT